MKPAQVAAQVDRTLAELSNFTNEVNVNHVQLPANP